MRGHPARVGSLVLVLALLCQVHPAFALITRSTPLREVLASEQLIFTAKVAKLDRDKPVLVLQVADDLKGKAPFRTLAVNLTPDGQGQREGHTPKLLKRLAPELTLIVFASKRAQRYTAFAYTNGTWFQMISQAGKDSDVIRWSFTHCEPYLRRTFKGTTAELQQIVVDGLAGKKPPPEPDLKEPPGLGPEIKAPTNCRAPFIDLQVIRDLPGVAGAESSKPRPHAPLCAADSGASKTQPRPHKEDASFLIDNVVDPRARAIPDARLYEPPPNPSGPLFAVIPTFVIFGPLALLASLFPVLFGGLALLTRRWFVLLSIACLNSTLYLAHSWFQRYFQDSGWGKPAPLWCMLALMTLAGIYWSWRRQKSLREADRERAVAGPWRGARIVLWAMSLIGLGVSATCAHQGTLLNPPWKELLVIWSVAWVGALHVTWLVFARKRPQGSSTERVMLWALLFACVGIAATSLPRSAQAESVKLLWTFEPGERGAIISSPTVQEDRVYVAAIQGAGFSSYGVVYCLNRATGEELWHFDDDGAMQQVFSSPCLAGGQLYIGEGLHENRGCKLYCLDAATGRKRWHFETASHIESSPCVADGKVYVGAGEDGIYCLDALTGAEHWHFQGNVHVDANPIVSSKRLYAGSGVSRTQKDMRVFCLDADSGQVLWRHPAKLPAWGSPWVAGDRVFFGLGNGRFNKSTDQSAGALLCVDAQTGKEIWCHDVEGAVLMAPAGDDHSVYFGSRDHCCYCLRQVDGHLQWKRDLGSPVVARPLARHHDIYVVSSAGRVCRLDAHTGEPIWRWEVADYAQSLATVFASPAGGTRESGLHHLYVGAALETPFGSRAMLYCLEDHVHDEGAVR